jgi:polysaccharide export outer membrane protein
MPKWLANTLVLVLFSARLYAQAALQHREPIPQYVLGPGDQISLHVADMEELPDRPLTINPSGMIDLPLAGPVKAAGLTIPEFKSSLSGLLSRYITKPEVSVNLLASGSQPISVIGEVNTPGVHQLDGTKRLLEILSLSGGLKPDAGPNIYVTRQNKWGSIKAANTRIDPVTGDMTACFSVDAVMSAKAPESNIILQPDDVISVPRADLVYVVGDVKKAGGFQLSTHETLSLLQAVTLAEGLGPDSSAGHARILRPIPGNDGTPKEIPVDVDKIMAGKSPDVRLFANDVLFIPRSGIKVTARRAMEAAIGITSGILIYR